MDMEQIPSTTVLLELLPADANDADPALITTIATDVATRLCDQGETVQPVYSGQRGGELILQIVSAIWANKEIILTDLSSLGQVLTSVVQVVQYIKQAYGKHVGQELAQKQPIKVTLEVKGAKLTVEMDDAVDARALASQLALQIVSHSSPANSQTTLSNAVKIQAQIPKRPARKRR